MVDAYAMHRSSRLNRRLSRPRALGVHFHLGLMSYDSGDLYGVLRHRAAVGILPEGGAESLEFMALDWRARWLEDRRDDALETAQEIVRRFPDDPDAVLELGHILNDLEQPEAAIEALLVGASRNGDDADLWYEIGLIAERLERWDLRRNAFQQVWRLEHELEPARHLFLTEAQFTAVVEATLARLPPLIRETLGNIAIFVEDYPEEWIIDGDIADPRILGLFDGPDRSAEYRSDTLIEGPARVYLYRWNIERACASTEEAEEQVAITVLHEVGHYLGLDEEALHYLGLS